MGDEKVLIKNILTWLNRDAVCKGVSEVKALTDALAYLTNRLEELNASKDS